MDEITYKRRTKLLGLAAIRVAGDLPRNRIANVLTEQLVRSATSVGANYRAACRGRSRAEVLARLAVVEEEADEVLYWLELLTESGHLSPENVTALWKEANEILSMTVASIKTLRGRLNPKSKIQNPKSDQSA